MAQSKLSKIEKKQKAAIYCRVSTPGQREDHTIESQKRELPLYAESQGWDIHDIYVDEGISGSSIEKRPDFQRLLNDMEWGLFDILLVIAHDRVTRTENPEERGRILRLLKDNSIQLASPHEGSLDLSMFSGELMTTLKFLFAGEENAERARRLRRGKIQKMLNGEYPSGHLPYGLMKDNIFDKATGRKLKNRVVQNPEEVKVLRDWIYDLVVNEGRSLTYVAKYLNEKGIKPRIAYQWDKGSLAAILRHENALTGTLLAGKTIPELEEPIKIPVEPIFSKAEYEKLKAAVTKNRPVGMMLDREEVYLLRNRLKCDLCDGKYLPAGAVSRKKNQNYRYYKCKNSCKNSPNVSAPYLDETIWNEIIFKLFWNPKKTLKDWVHGDTGFKKRINRRKKKIERTNNQISELDKQRLRVGDAVVTGAYTRDEADSKIFSIRKSIKSLEEERAQEQALLRADEKAQSNAEIANKGAKDIEKLGQRLFAKVDSLPVGEKAKLLDYLLPPGQCITIMPLTDPDLIGQVHLIPGQKKRKRINFEYWIEGRFNLDGFLKALKEFDKTGEIPFLLNDKHYFHTILL